MNRHKLEACNVVGIISTSKHTCTCSHPLMSPPPSHHHHHHHHHHCQIGQRLIPTLHILAYRIPRLHTTPIYVHGQGNDIIDTSLTIRHAIIVGADWPRAVLSTATYLLVPMTMIMNFSKKSRYPSTNPCHKEISHEVDMESHYNWLRKARADFREMREVLGSGFMSRWGFGQGGHERFPFLEGEEE